ncbi:MAG: S8 family serine peptidase [Bacteroidales bacterium]|nr:S8 family serine peptidase [Bacteroidales bacterium]
MNNRLLTAAVLAAVTVWGCKTEQADLPVEVPAEGETVNETSLIPGQMIIQLSDELAGQLEEDLAGGSFLQTKSASVNSVFAGIGATSVERLYPDAGEWEPRHREAGLHKWYKVTFDPALPQTKAVRSINDIPGIEYAEPVRRIKSTAFFDDPDLSKQWHYTNEGTLTAKHKKGCDINVLPVWENYTCGKSDVIVSVVDGGVDLTHEDLAAVCLPGGANGSRNFVTGSFGIVAHSHGTHVAGTIGAINNNGKGVAGIAGGRDGQGGVTIMSCQVFQDNPDDPDHDLTGNFYDAMVWGADHGAVISQNSWGDVYEKEEDALKGGPGAMKSAIDYFIRYAGTDKNGNQTGPMKGGVVIFAAGNSGWSIGWPAAYAPVIAVGSVAPDFTRAYYSNYGDWVDIAAPGGSAYYDKGQVYSTLPDNKYGWMQGTSMACPHVSGVAALIISHYGGPGFTNDMLVDRLLNGANSNVLSSATQIGPLCDAYGSMAYGSKEPPATPKSHTVSAHSNFLDFSTQVTSDPDDNKAYGFLLLASRNEASLKNLDYFHLPSDVFSATLPVGEADLGDTVTGTLSGLDFQTEYYTTVVAYDYSKNYSGTSPVVKVITGTNTPPVIKSEYAGLIQVKAHEVYNLESEIYDPDGHTVTVKFTPGSDAAQNLLLPSGLYRMTLAGKDADAGRYEARYDVTDSFGASSSVVYEYQILENHPPVPVGNPDDLVFTGMAQKKTLNMEDYVSDPDGEQLKYEISSSPSGIVHLNQVDNTLNLTTLSMGLAKVIITGTDIKGEKAVLELNVLVRDPNSDPDVYPTQVNDYLNISDGTEKTLQISISSASAAMLYNGTVTCDAFSPARIDMSGWAPGRYGVTVVSGEKTFKTTVVKI